ncbi:MAG TPA: DMT family transporter, partial [Mycobacterium sp.]|nr:DMT family transporter [Mycobacterium sp.]
ELPLTLIAASHFLRAPMGAREWGAVATMTLGLAVLLACLAPSPATKAVPWTTWVVGSGLSIGAVVGLVVVGAKSEGPRRATLYGVATGIEFGFTAALMKGTTNQFSHGFYSILTSWETYAMILAGIGGMFLMQNAVHAGRLVAAQPGITLLDPFTAVGWGIFAFGEPVRSGPILIGAALGGVAMGVGAVMLSRSSVLDDQNSERGPRSSEQDQETEPAAHEAV